ncbi:MAG TPA: tyrosine--tRNA ligase [Thermoplasmata archaeon]|nr:tyrosine--tRNA ligase [Thermoplasmata archaeon]
MDAEERMDRVVRNTVEVLTREEVRELLATHDHPKAYIGFEPSGILTVAHLITARKIVDLLEAGCDVTVFLADWHAWINDKLDGDLARIRASGECMAATFTALGADPSRARYRWAHELTGSSDYWARVVRVAKATSLARTKRAMSIMGRSEEESDLDTSRLFYPAMQGADIFELPVELAYGGMDQRRAHVLVREVAHHYAWPVPTAIHTPLLASLKGSGRMDPVGPTGEGKMSKSDPSSGIPLPTDRATIERRIAGAFCPAKQVDGNPVVEVVRFILFPWEGKLSVERTAAHGGPVEFPDAAAFTTAWTEGRLHPQDLKTAVVSALDRLVEPVRRYFVAHPEHSPATFLSLAPGASTRGEPGS